MLAANSCSRSLTSGKKLDKQGLACNLLSRLLSCSGYSSNLNLEAICSSETSVDF
jgi:hypothetical protein